MSYPYQADLLSLFASFLHVKVTPVVIIVQCSLNQSGDDLNQGNTT